MDCATSTARFTSYATSAATTSNCPLDIETKPFDPGSTGSTQRTNTSREFYQTTPTNDSAPCKTPRRSPCRYPNKPREDAKCPTFSVAPNDAPDATTDTIPSSASGATSDSTRRAFPDSSFDSTLGSTSDSTADSASNSTADTTPDSTAYTTVDTTPNSPACYTPDTIASTTAYSAASNRALSSRAFIDTTHTARAFRAAHAAVCKSAH
mmetsp:Transcript_78883/g.218227  ORF Transcript_78883/g.218227 Transcript_78883/m.218227 type:complete len:209 (-) Transcript_78883:852-1478(-)